MTTRSLTVIPRPSITVVASERGILSLGERIRLLHHAIPGVGSIVSGDARSAWRKLDKSGIAYLVDLNGVTVPLALRLAALRRPYILDTGDDPKQLAKAAGKAGRAQILGLAEKLALASATGVVCRGSVHIPILRAKTRAPLCWAPDTVPDEILDDELKPQRDDLLATFGYAARPVTVDRAYGWEVIDVISKLQGMHGLIIASGPGAPALRSRARRLGVHNRVTILGPLAFDRLVTEIAPAAFVTSVQSDDVAGWVRTTGKLPVALGMGKAIITTRVGEAWRVLPSQFLISPGSDEELATSIAQVVTRGVPPGWPEQARALAEQFRRSYVSRSLRAFLADIGSSSFTRRWKGEQ